MEDTEVDKPIFHKYPKIRQLGHEDNTDIFSDPDDIIVIQEKIDGANFRFMITETGIVFGSRSQELDPNKEDKAWKRCIDHINARLLERVDYMGDLSLFEGFIFYGECCTPHSVHYNWDEMPVYLGFDIYDLKDKVYLNGETAKKTFEELGLDFVPIIKLVKAGTIKQITDKDVPQSTYYEGPAEGIVFKNSAKQLMAKYVTDKFKEVNKATFGGGKKFAKTDDEVILAKYCTNARIDKQIFKLIHEGHKLDMPLMKFLPTAVYKDIMEEEGQEILFSKFRIDFRQLKRLVTRRCLAVLKQAMMANTLNKEK